MFTGLVSAVGRVGAVSRQALPENGRRTPASGTRGADGGGGGGAGPGQGLTLTIRAPYKGIRRGESIAVNGACLTVARVVKGGFTVQVVDTTTERTLFGEYATGRSVNLERAVRASDRLGGHFVQGHVDGVAVVERVEPRGDAWVCDLRVPPAVGEAAIPRGAIAVDGVSLTINEVPARDLVQISLIPFTREHTTLGRVRVGDRVHVEGDILGKYVRQLCHTTP